MPSCGKARRWSSRPQGVDRRRSDAIRFIRSRWSGKITHRLPSGTVSRCDRFASGAPATGCRLCRLLNEEEQRGDPFPGHDDRQSAGVRAARAGQGPHVQLRPDGLHLRAHRQLPRLPLRRPAPPALEYHGSRSRQVMNITDVGHMTERRRRAARTRWRRRRAARRRTPGDRAVLQGGLLRRPRRAQHPARRTATRAPPSTSQEMIALVQALIERRATPTSSTTRCYYDITTLPRLRRALPQHARGAAGGRRRAAERRDARRASATRTTSRSGRVDPKHMMQWDRPGAAAIPAGTSSARPCRASTWATRSTSTPAARTTSSRTTSARSRADRAVHRQAVRPATGCTRGILMVDGQKMSKSLGNFYTVRGPGGRRATTRSRSATC